MLTTSDAKRVNDAKVAIVESDFAVEDWNALARILGDAGACITAHPRLRRSLSFGDDDYPSCVSEVLLDVMETDGASFERLEDYLRVVKGCELGGVLSGESSSIVINPKVFTIPEGDLPDDTCAIMMPFASEFGPVRKAIKGACDAVGLRPVVADEVWRSPSIVQDVFDMIYVARAVVADFSGLNPNVMYEMGLAHALGRDVVPKARRMDRIPFDVAHYRTILYDNTPEGLARLRRELGRALRGVLGWRLAGCPAGEAGGGGAWGLHHPGQARPPRWVGAWREPRAAGPRTRRPRGVTQHSRPCGMRPAPGCAAR